MDELVIRVTRYDHIQGALDSTCTLVEYGDYECDLCRDVQPAIKNLQAHFGKQLAFVFRNFPLLNIHPWAGPAAELAEYAGSQGQFWQMHDLLLANQTSLNKTTFRELCEQLGLIDFDILPASSSAYLKARVHADLDGGMRSSVDKTPTFFLNGDRYDGLIDYESFVSLVDQVLIANGD